MGEIREEAVFVRHSNFKLKSMMKTGKLSIEKVVWFIEGQLKDGRNIAITIHLKNHNIEKIEFNGHARTDEEIASALGGK